MGDLGATLIKELNCETAFTIGGIGISESVVVTWIMMAVVFVVSLIVTHGLKVEHPGRGQLLLENAVTWLQGIGEAFTYGAPLAVMKYLVENTLGPKLIGRDPADIDGIWQTLYISTLASGRRSMTLGAISGIDIALWDLKGNASISPSPRCWAARGTASPATPAAAFMPTVRDWTACAVNWKAICKRATPMPKSKSAAIWIDPMLH